MAGGGDVLKDVRIDELKEAPAAQQGRSSDLVTLLELTVSNAYEIAALVGVLERKGILTQSEVLDDINRLKAAKA